MRRTLPFLLLAALLSLAACEGGNHYEPPAYSLGKCFWQPYLPNC